MTITEVEEFIKNSNGKIFSIKFKKRHSDEIRTMVCRTGVTKFLKGGEKAYIAENHDLITVYDMVKKGYRSIPKEGVTEILIDGEWTNVTK